MLSFKDWILYELVDPGVPEKERIPLSAVPRYSRKEEPPVQGKTPTNRYIVKRKPVR